MASNVHVTKSSPEDYRDNPVRLPPAAYAHPDREYQPPVEPTDWRVVLARTVALLAAYAVYSLWKTSYCWSGVRYGACLQIAAYEPLAIAGGVVLCGALMAWHHAAKIGIVRAQANRTNLVLDRYRNYMPADIYSQADPRDVLRFVTARYAMDTQLEKDTAEWKRLWSVNTLSGDGQTSISTNIAPLLGDGSEPQAVITPDSVWLPWLTELPHTMIAGGTGTGKTTLARVELYERLSQGYAGIVLDPKGKDWYNLPVIGGGRKFELILAMLDQLHGEMADRFTAYADGERTFQPIKAIVDEVPDIMDACLDMRRRLVDGRWSRFSRQLGSLAREIGISVTLMTQSPLVEDIGMNSAMRKNFNRIALGDEVLKLLREETDAKRRALLQDALRGQQYPAAMLRRGAVHLLDTSNVVRLSQRHIAAPLGWQPACSAPPPLATGAIIYPPGIVSTNAKIAWLLRSNYSYRQIERELSVSHATIAAVSKWLQTKAHTNGAT